MSKIRIAWLTGSSFIDVDIHLIPELSKKFYIKWIIVRQKECWYSESEIQNFISENDIDVLIFNMPGRLRSLGAFKVYKNAIQAMREFKPDIYYINYIGIPYLWPLITISDIDKNKVIYPCHDYIDHVGVKNRKYYVWMKRLIFTCYKHFQFFSRTQQNLFINDYGKKKDSFYAPLALKGFGQPNINKNVKDNKVRFLFFGNIRENKGLEFLISAANSLYEKYTGQFEVMIYGNCSNWECYERNIKHIECFDLQIRRVENREIADLFTIADYLMLPYRDVTQSGPLLIAYYYNLPVIASDHAGFREYIEDGKTGFIHRNEDSEDLYRVMANAIIKRDTYNVMKDNLTSFIEENISLSRIISMYEQGFNDMVKGEVK